MQKIYFVNLVSFCLFINVNTFFQPPDATTFVTRALILNVVLSHFDADREKVLSKDRAAYLVMIRRIIIVLAKQYTDLSYVQIGKRLNRSHWTIMHSFNGDPKSYFHRYAKLDDEEAKAVAGDIWERINAVNLRDHILSTRYRADVVLYKTRDHRIASVAVDMR